MDGDHSAKTMDSAANSAIKTSDMGDGIHESAKGTVSPQWPQVIFSGSIRCKNRQWCCC